MKREYPRKVVEYARRLHEEGYAITEIRGKLSTYGYTPSWQAVKRWVDDDYRERERLRHALRYRARGERCKSPETVSRVISRRIRDLRSVGLSYRDIAAVIGLDFEVTVSDEQVRYACKEKGGELTDRAAREVAERRGLVAA